MESVLKKIWLTALIALTALTTTNCDDSFDVNEEQRDYIVEYLTSSHSPTLISEAEVGASLEIDPPFYTTFAQFAYRYIEDYYNTDRETKTEVKNGSTITITYKMYGFAGSAIDSTTLPVYSNDATLEEDYIAAGLTTTYWDFTPLEITIGKSNILESIQQGLIGCKNGDNVEIYMTRNASYNGDVIGLIPEGEALLFICTIESVE